MLALQDEDYIKSTSDKLPDVGKKMEYMLNTGNLVSKTGLDISQATGFTVVAEKLNFFRFTPASIWLLKLSALCCKLSGVIPLFVHTSQAIGIHIYDSTCWHDM